MATARTAPSPLPPHILSPHSLQQNGKARSPIGRTLPLRKPSLKDATASPKRKIPDEAATNKTLDSPPTAKRRRVEPPPEHDMAEQMNRDVEMKYVIGKKIGEGTYADVHKAHLRDDPNYLVAVKRFKRDEMKTRDGINVDTVREIKYTTELRHSNIVVLYDIFAERDQRLCMVIEFASGGNLEELIKDTDGISYGIADTKAWMGMLLRGVYFCHRNFVLHRDIKPGNLLLNADGNLKLADFGLARSFAGPEQVMTHVSITLWYRPPEMLYGATHYSGAVDIWSCGMVFAELLLRRPFAPANIAEDEFQGGELKQLDVLNTALGSATEEVWPGVSKLPLYHEPQPHYPIRDRRSFRGIFKNGDDVGVDLLRQMLTYDPRKRPTAQGCLEDSWWSTEPRPTEAASLPRKKNIDEKAMGDALANPGKVEPQVDEKFRGVARKLDFGAPK
ncbi:TFIIH complex serine/threonine-protein kinase subunit kin28 [Lithohypha guttulata]|uniref:TFIIH complex serine/threonine-protein kinase subunit kin28 n=1 Tax=Lithohypha guttulata TaxID=1690604 RepID=UPI002DE0C56F|nr:TFIIH complex serine/threonine-protein kinase subunit kin28 [Lithohypha guttulata]